MGTIVDLRKDKYAVLVEAILKVSRTLEVPYDLEIEYEFAPDTEAHLPQHQRAPYWPHGSGCPARTIIRRVSIGSR